MLLMLLAIASNVFADNKYGLKDKIQDGVILHCFDWKLSDIQAEIPNIAKAGFTAVQTSPLHQKEPLNSAWYMTYQPYDYIIGNGLGSESDLKALCAEAHKYGVKVIVDVVANHTNGDLNYVAPRLKDTSLYHDYNGGTNDGDRYSITHGRIGMWDLKTEDPRVQTIISEYIQSLKACGVDGIRWDAIKHIGLPSEGDSFMKNVVDQTMYNYGEILNTPGPNADQLYKEYTQYMSVTDNTYGNGVTQSFSNGGVSSSTGNLTYRGIAANKLAHEADVVIGVGTRYTDFTTASKWLYRTDAKFVNINPSEFQAYKMDATPVVADANEALTAIGEELAKIGYHTDKSYAEEVAALRKEWWTEVERLDAVEYTDKEHFTPEINDANRECVEKYIEDTGCKLCQTAVLGAINHLIDDDAIVCAAAECDEAAATAALEQCGYHPKIAIVMLLCGCTAEEAEKRLAEKDGYIARVVG